MDMRTIHFIAQACVSWQKKAEVMATLPPNKRPTSILAWTSMVDNLDCIHTDSLFYKHLIAQGPSANLAQLTWDSLAAEEYVCQPASSRRASGESFRDVVKVA